MKNFLLAIACMLAVNSSAQINTVSLQASGLTCSMCNNAISKALKSIDYVAKVTTDIKNAVFEISFKPGAKVNFDQLKKKVEDAGFHVARLTANINFKNLQVEDNTHVNVDGMVFHFLNVKSQTLSGEKKIQVIDKGFVSAKQFKKNELYTTMGCYKTGVSDSSCSKTGLVAGTRIFHVTI